MTETLYGWMRNLACYFIFLSAVMHFLPDNNYKKYIQFYMGLLLILLLLSPVLDFLHLENKIDAGVDRYMEEEERDREEWENYAREIEEEYGWNKKMRTPGDGAAGGRCPAGRSGGTMKLIPEMLKKSRSW